MVDGPGGKEVGRLALKVVPDTSEVLPELRAFAERVEEQVTIDLKVHLDPESVNEELRLLQAEMDAADLTLDIDTEIDSTASLAQLAGVLAEMQALASSRNIHIDTELNAGASIAGGAALGAGGAASGAAGGASHFGAQIALWGPLIVAAAVAIAAIGPALAVLLPLVAGVAAGIAVIALGWNEVKDVLKPVGAAFKAIRDDLGDLLTAGLEPLLKAFVTGFVPILQTGLETFATLINGAATSLLKFLSSTEGLGLMRQLFDDLAPALTPLAQAVGPIAEVFLRLSIAAVPALQMMSEAILRVSEGLASWLSSADATSTIQDSMTLLGQALAVVGEFVADVFPPLFAAAPALIAAFSGIADVVAGLFMVLEPLFVFMGEHQTTVAIITALLTGLAIAVAAVGAALFIASLPFNIWVIAAGAVIGALLYLYANFEWFRNAVSVGFRILMTAAKIYFAPIIALVKLIAATVQAVAPSVGAALSSIGGFFASLYTTARDKITSVITKVKELPGQALDALSGIGDTLRDAGRELIGGFIKGIGDKFGDVKNKLGSLTKSLTSWKGPESLDRVILYGSGQLVIGGFIRGLESEYENVHQSLSGFTDSLSDGLAVDGAAALDANTSNIVALLDALGVDTSNPEVMELIISNWDKGKGFMRGIASDQVAGYSAARDTDDLMGAPPR